MWLMAPIASLSQSTLPLDWTAQLAGLEVNYTAFEELMSSDTYEKRVLAHDFNQDGTLDFMVLRSAPEGSGLPATNVFGRRQIEGSWVQSGRVWHLNGGSPVGNFTAGAFGDFDGDGWDDLVLVGRDDTHPRLLRNTGNLDPVHFMDGFDGFLDESDRLPTFFQNERNFGDVAVGDINGDGHLDIYMLASSTDDSYAIDYLLLNNGDGTFDDDTEAVMGFIRSRTAIGKRVALVDFDGNGHLDVVKTSIGFDVTPWNDSGVFVLYNDGNDLGTDWQKLSAESGVQDFAVGHFDEDLGLDIYVAAAGTDEWVEHGFMFLGQHTLFRNTVDIPSASDEHDRVWVSDLDANGHDDVILGNSAGGPCMAGAGAHILQFGENGFEDHAPDGLVDEWAPLFNDLAIGDFNANGLPDVLIGRCTGLELLIDDNCHAAAGTGDTDGDGLYDGCDPCPYNASPTCEDSLQMPEIDLSHSVARQWIEMTLASIRHDYSRPTVHARNLFHVSAAMWDAWAAIDSVAVPFLLGQSVDGFPCDFSDFPVDADPAVVQTEREKAMAYAAARILQHRFPLAPGWPALQQAYPLHLERLGFDPDFVGQDYSGGDGRALGNAIAACYIFFGTQDGANEANNYASQHYQPVNEPTIIGTAPFTPPLDMNRWQPIEFAVFEDQSSNIIESTVPEFVTPEWGHVTPFALTEEQATFHERDGHTYRMFLDPGTPPLWDDQGSLVSDQYATAFAMTAIWSSHLDPANGTMWDISPASIGNRETLPTNYTEAMDFYNFHDGGTESPGHPVNPSTGLPYEPNIVPRADYARVLAEYWADGPESETPPGHWFTILNYVMDQPVFERRYAGQGAVLDELEWDIKAYFSLGGAMHDAAVATWSIKGWYDFIRPLSAIRAMALLGQRSDPGAPSYHPGGLPLIPGLIGINNPDGSGADIPYIRCWDGYCDDAYYPCNVATPWGVDWLPARQWLSYQPQLFLTPPFAGYVSGHSTFSRAAAEVLTHVTGDAYFPGGMGTFSAPALEFLGFDVGPSVDVHLQWATYRDAADESGLSRIWGGIHPFIDDYPARQNGIVIGQQAALHAQSYFVASTEGCMDPLACDYDPLASIAGTCQYPTDSYFIPEILGQAVIVPCGNEPVPSGYMAASIDCFLQAVEGSDHCMLNWSTGCQQAYEDCSNSEYGCTDDMMCNYNPAATIDDGSCQLPDHWLIPEELNGGPAVPYCGSLSGIPDGYQAGVYDCVEQVVIADGYCLVTNWDQLCENQYADCVCDFPADGSNAPPTLIPDPDFFSGPLTIYCGQYYEGIFDDIVDEVAAEITVEDECPETVRLSTVVEWTPWCGVAGNLYLIFYYADFQGLVSSYSTNVQIIDSYGPSIQVSPEMYYDVNATAYSDLDAFFALAEEDGFEGGSIVVQDDCGAASYTWYENAAALSDSGTFYRHIIFESEDECGNQVGSGANVFYNEIPASCGWWIPDTPSAGPAEFGCVAIPGYHLASSQACADNVINNDAYCIDFFWDQICQDAYDACLLLTPGCLDTAACNFDASAEIDDGSCDYACLGCLDDAACNFNPVATVDDGSCDFSCLGCLDPESCNFNPLATIETLCDYACIGCMDDGACNYDPSATISNGACDYPLADIGCPCNSVWSFDTGPLNGGAFTTETFLAYSPSTLDSIVVHVEFEQVEGTWVRDLALGICDPSGNCFEIGGSNMNIGYGEAGPWPLSWTTPDDGLYDAALDVSSFGLNGEGEWSFYFLHAETTHSDTAIWSGTIELIEVCAGNPTPPLPGCIDETACNFDPFATEDDGSCYHPGDECFELGPCYDAALWSSTCNCEGTINDFDEDGYCSFEDCDDGNPLIPAEGTCEDTWGCTDQMACNYDPTATANDGSCIPADYWLIPEFEQPGGAIPWCGDPLDLPFGYMIGDYFCVAVVVSNHPDCIYLGWNEPPNAGSSEGYGFAWCEDDYIACQGQAGCTDPAACNFDGTASVDDGTCVYSGDSCAELGCTTVATLDANCDCIVEEFLDTDDDGICDGDEVPGCTDPDAENFDANATDSNPFLCEYLGCTDPEAPNFDPQANVDDGTCIPPVYGCTDSLASNHNPLANVDDGSCTYVYGCMDPAAFNFDPAAVLDDGSCDYGDIAGCTDPAACNFDGAANWDDGSCEYPETGYDCGGGCLTDSDGDGICDAFEIAGCTDPSADNHDPSATDDDGSCDYGNDDIFGCTDPFADNYDSSATVDDGTCDYGNNDIYGCTDPAADNYDPAANLDDGSCDYGNNDLWGCTYSDACNFDPFADMDDGTCFFPAPGYDCDGNCIGDSDGDEVPDCLDGCPNDPNKLEPGECGCGLPDADANGNGTVDCLETFGCTDPGACNFEAAATADNGSCIYPSASYLDCSGQCLADADGDGICDVLEVAGCTDPDAMNHNPFATDDDGSCIMALQPGCTYSEASNFNDAADYDDGSCTFGASPDTCPADVDEDGTVAVADLLIILGAFGESCIPE